MKYKLSQYKKNNNSKSYREFRLLLEVFDNDMNPREDLRYLIDNFIKEEHGFQYGLLYSELIQDYGYDDEIRKCSRGHGSNLIDWVVHEGKVHIWNKLEKLDNDTFDEGWFLSNAILEITRRYIELFNVYDEELGYTSLTDEIFEVEDVEAINVYDEELGYTLYKDEVIENTVPPKANNQIKKSIFSRFMTYLFGN